MEGSRDGEAAAQASPPPRKRRGRPPKSATKNKAEGSDHPQQKRFKCPHCSASYAAKL